MRRQRDATEGAAEQDAWSRHVADRSMLKVADLDAARHAAGSIGAVRTQRPAPLRAWAPADHEIASNVTENEINSHDTAIETQLGAHLASQEACT